MWVGYEVVKQYELTYTVYGLHVSLSGSFTFAPKKKISWSVYWYMYGYCIQM